jgi:glutaminyl-tRNA synthetase
VDTEVRLYDRLFTVENPLGDKEKDFKEFLNPESLQVITAKLEPGAARATAGTKFQFERVGYFCADLDTAPDKPVFNRTLTLRAPKKVM